jgi:sterol desaturase/sphingolipid hydroxylase (fatty acid hydroxylase superfamily)
LNWLSGTFGSFPHFVLTLGPPIIPGVLLDFSGPEFLFGYVSFVFIQHWNHSNVAVARGSWFEWFFITPQAHRIHHAASRELHDANFGFVFTAWDRMFGTFVDPNTVLEDFEVGLGEREKPGLLRMIIGY